MEESFTKHLPFSLLVTNLENEVLKRDPQIILGFFDPDDFFFIPKKTRKCLSILMDGSPTWHV